MSMAKVGTISAIQDHQLFDRSYYLQHNPDVASETGIDPLLHYLSHGGWEGRDPHPLFDSSFYLEQNPQVAQQKINPLVHFVAEGARQGLDPHPLFSTSFYLGQGLTMAECSFNPLVHYLESGAQQGFDPHPFFDGSFYLQQLENLEGKAVLCNPLVHYLTVGAQCVLEPSPVFDAKSYCQRYPDVAAACINPLLHYVTIGQSEDRVGMKLSGIADGARSVRSASFQSALARWQAATEEPFSHLIVIGCLLRGGYERCASNFARAIARKTGIENVLILVTDIAETTCCEWLPDGVRIVNLPQLEGSLAADEKRILLLELLARKQPAVAIGMNAPLFWSALDVHIETWKRELTTKLVAYLASYECCVNCNFYGFNDGPLHRLAHCLDSFVVDHIRLRDAMIRMHSNVPSISSKVVACYKSIAEDLHQTLCLRSRLPRYGSASDCRAGQKSAACTKILWASRLDEWKQPDILAKIAEQMPDVQFDVYGRDYPGTDLGCLRVLPNVALMGEYADFSTIPTDDKAAFLYTSKADGMPHVLLEAGACRLPVIAPDIGGISELIDDSTGWLLRHSDDVAEYVRVIRYVLEHPEIALERAANLKTLIDERHNWSAFLERTDQLDIWESRSRCSS